jgi:ethanolamine ammonia-lyase small subunit
MTRTGLRTVVPARTCTGRCGLRLDREAWFRYLAGLAYTRGQRWTGANR